VQSGTPIAFVYLLAAVADSWLLISHPPLNPPSKFASVLSFLAAGLFAVAAGVMSRRPRIAHMCAATGVIASSWIYTTTLQGNIYANQWIIFNVPDRELHFYDGVAGAGLAIIEVALIVFAIVTAILRLLPGRWLLRKMPLRERTWPAVAASFLFLAIWFSQSVMPYRIPGALDYSSWPILQILHIQKRGLQFHETCIRVLGYRGAPESVSFAWNDRRLFKYRFQQSSAHVEASFKSLGARLASLIQSSKTLKSNRKPITPLRRWNDEGWYVAGEGVELQAYTKESQGAPPEEVVNLFNDLEKAPRTLETLEDRKDVCLGFCYDPLSGLGALYANHRCRYEATSRDYVCR
jgi:hypothetical protein